MKRERLSNYDQMARQTAANFIRYDQQTMICKFALAHDDSYLYIDFVGRHYRIDRQSGTVTWSVDGFAAAVAGDYNEVMSIYDVLCDSKPDCALSGRMINLSNLSAIQGGSLPKGGYFYENRGAVFARKGQALARACEALEGKPDGIGDVGYELKLFPFLPIAVHFWETDEDFPPSLQILVDSNILDFLRYETVMFAIDHLLSRLKELTLEE